MKIEFSQPEGADPLEDPFIIRGHHLQYLTPLAPPMNQDPRKFVHSLRVDSEKDRGELPTGNIDWKIISEQKSDEPGFWPAYAVDLIGESETDADAFEASLYATLHDYLTLSTDAAVVLAARGLDKICASCTFKIHCKLPSQMEEDAKYLDIFEDVLEFAQSKDDSLQVGAERQENGDIITTAQAVRRVTSHFAIANIWSGNLFRDALDRRKRYGNVFAGPDVSAVERYYDSYGDEVI